MYDKPSLRESPRFRSEWKRQIREVVAQHDDMNECASDLASQDLVVSFAEGRRLWAQLPHKEASHGKPE